MLLEITFGVLMALVLFEVIAREDLLLHAAVVSLMAISCYALYVAIDEGTVLAIIISIAVIPVTIFILSVKLAEKSEQGGLWKILNRAWQALCGLLIIILSVIIWLIGMAILAFILWGVLSLIAGKPLYW